VPLTDADLRQVAERMLADYDAHRPNEIFAERGADWLTLEEAYAVQHAVARLREARGERCLGYKVGCISPVIQQQLGLDEPVRGFLWANEAHMSGCHLSSARFASLAIEGEIAVRLRRDVPMRIGTDADLMDCIDGWFPVIELHEYLFRGPKPTAQELIAGNAMHMGFVAPPAAANRSVASLDQAEIRIEIDGELAEIGHLGALPGGPLGSAHWLAASLARAQETLRAGSILLTGSPGRLIPVNSGTVIVTCGGEQVSLSVGAHKC
jgi:2-keto-4-pentenoate hydratase